MPAAWRELPALAVRLSTGLARIVAALRGGRGSSSSDGDAHKEVELDFDKVKELCTDVVELFRVVLQASWAHQTLIASGNLAATGVIGVAASEVLLLPADVLRILHCIIFTVRLNRVPRQHITIYHVLSDYFRRTLYFSILFA